MKAIIFDFNGTLVDEDADRLIAFREIFPKKSEKELLELLVKIEQIDLMHPDWKMSKIVSEAAGEEIGEKYVALRESYIDTTVISSLKKLKENGYILMILTTSKKESVISALSRAGILDLFVTVYSTRNSTEKKPSTSLIRKLLEENNLKPENCIFVGDDPIQDLLPAKALGMKTILVGRFADKVIVKKNDIFRACESL